MNGKGPVVNEHCVCGIRVAPFDPDKFEANGRRFHKKCYKEKLSQAMQDALLQQQPNQLYLF